MALSVGSEDIARLSGGLFEIEHDTHAGESPWRVTGVSSGGATRRPAHATRRPQGAAAVVTDPNKVLRTRPP